MAFWIKKGLLCSLVLLFAACGRKESWVPPVTAPPKTSDALSEEPESSLPEAMTLPEASPPQRIEPPVNEEPAPIEIVREERELAERDADYSETEPEVPELPVLQERITEASPPGQDLLIPYHRMPFHAVPHLLKKDGVTAVAGAPLPLSPLSSPLGRKAPSETVPRESLALLPDRKEDLIPSIDEKIDPAVPSNHPPEIMAESQSAAESGREEEPQKASAPDAAPSPALPLLEDGPRLAVESPSAHSYYSSSILLKGRSTPSPETASETRNVKSVTWRIDALGDYDNSVFLEEDGSFESDIFTPGLEGSHNLILQTEDFGGGMTRQIIPLYDGNQPPEIGLDFPVQNGAYGSVLAVRGNIRDAYKGIAGLEGVQQLLYRLIPREREAEEKVLSGEIPLEGDNHFFFSLDMAERSGRQSLVLQAQGRNGSSSTMEIFLTPGGSDIPSFAVKPQDGRLVLSWDSVPGAEEQTVYLTDDGSLPSPRNLSNQFRSVESPLVLGSVANGLRYKVRLKILAEGKELWSDVAEAVPLAPGTLGLQAEGRFEQVRLEWKSVPGVSAFRIFRKGENDPDFVLLEDSVEGTEYTDAAVEFGRNYYYKIEPSGIPGPLSYEVAATSLEAPSEKITMSSRYREITPLKVTLSGEYAYVSGGESGFSIMDVSVPQKPERIGYLAIANVKDIYLEGEYAYVAAGSEGFFLVNIAEPTRPYIVMSRATDDASGIAAQGDTVFVADGGRGLQIFDISNRQDPRRISAYRDIPAYRMVLQGSRIYMASGSEGLKILDISNLYDPVLVQEYGNTPVYDVLVQDSRLYLACGDQGMVILEEASSGELVEISRFRSNNARMVRLWEDYAMIADGGGGMKAVDISLPEKPQLFGSFPGEDVVSVAMTDEYALIADVSGLKVLRTYLYGQSVHTLSLPTPGRAYGLLVEGSNLWVADRRGGVVQYDVSNPLKLSEQSILKTFPTEYAEDFLLKDELLYVADGPAGLRVFDRNAPGNPPLASVPVSGRARRVLPYGASVVVLSTGDGVMFVRNNQMTGRVHFPDVRDAAFYGSYLFVGDYEEGLAVLDAGDGTGRPLPLETLEEFEGIRQLMIKDDILYVLHRKGISLLGIRNPEHPVLQGEIAVSEAEAMQMTGRMLYVAEGYRGVSIYRIGPDFSALKVSDCEGIFAVDVAPFGSYAFFADMDGIGVIQVLIPEWLRE